MKDDSLELILDYIQKELELNFKLECFFDAGYVFTWGDETNGYGDSFNCNSMNELRFFLFSWLMENGL